MYNYTCVLGVGWGVGVGADRKPHLESSRQRKERVVGDYKAEKWERVGDYQTKGRVVGDYQTKGKVVGDYQTEKWERVGDYQTEKGERGGLPGSWRAEALSWSVVHCIAHLVARI